MNWYKKAQQKYLWDNDPQLPYVNDVPETTVENTWDTSGDLETDIEESKNEEELNRALQANGIDPDSAEEIIFPNNEKIWTIMYGDKLYIIEISFPYPWFKDAEEWIWDISNSGNVWMYVDERDFSKEFWDGVGDGTTYYHGTSEGNLDSILREGLSPRDETRGMSNRSVGAKVFLSEEYNTAISHYEFVLEVDLGAMKRDGYMPTAKSEEDVEEGEIMNALAHKIGLYNFEYEIEQGMDPGTIVLDGGIPPQYIREI